jgi:hypothetical protein
MILPKISLRFCLMGITGIDFLISVFELMNYISMELYSVKPRYYVYSSIVEFLLLIPIIVFEILVLRYYQLLHAKALYGIKLGVGIFAILLHLIFYLYKICPMYPRINEKSSMFP